MPTIKDPANLHTPATRSGGSGGGVPEQSGVGGGGCDDDRITKWVGGGLLTPASFEPCRSNSIAAVLWTRSYQKVSIEDL